MAEEKEAAKKKVKRPTAQKRDLQSERRRQNNRAFKAKVSTAIRSLRESLSKGDKTAAQKELSDVYSLMDKGVKTKKFKLNKARRVKARLHKSISAK